jgi:hypothetical protein
MTEIIATEAHGKTRKNKILKKYFRVLPGLINELAHSRKCNSSASCLRQAAPDMVADIG